VEKKKPDYPDELLVAPKKKRKKIEATTQEVNPPRTHSVTFAVR